MRLYDHQKEALDLLAKHDNFAILMDMGTGKTCVTILDWLRRGDLNLLVIAPKSVYRNWYGELEKFIPEEIKKSILVSHWVSGGKKVEKEAIQRILKPWSNYRRVFLINVEAFSGVSEAIKATKAFIASGPCMLVIDESTRIRNHGSNRTKEIINIGGESGVKVRRILSGLVAPNSPMNLFSQFYFLDWRILGFRNYYSFRSRYAVMKKTYVSGRSFDQIVGFQNMEELQRKVLSRSFRKLKSDCLDLPEKIWVERSVELSPEQAKAYKELQKKATTMLSDGSHVTTTLAISLLLRLHQITYGHVRDDLGNIKELDASPRENELMELLQECDGKTIIWACYRPTILRLKNLISREFGDESLVEFWGGISGDQREISKDRFQNDPSCKFYLGNPSTGGIGVTLTAAKQVVYFCNDFDLEHRSQSEDRAHRIGLDHSVTYVDLVAKGTIDEKILDALKRKIDLAAAVTGESIREWIR